MKSKSEIKRQSYGNDKCACPCHDKPRAPECCQKCYILHGVNFRTYKNHIEKPPPHKDCLTCGTIEDHGLAD